ncbi:MAG: pilin [Firmicutes bacterium]|nr:pilin [Bacillota bacterium]
MRNTILKSIIIIQLVFVMSVFFVPTVFATPILDPDKYYPNLQDSGTSFVNKANTILGAVQVIGSIVSVVMLVVIGIKYITGTVEEKAEYKKSMLPYVIGAVLLFAASQLVQAMYNWITALNK